MISLGHIVHVLRPHLLMGLRLGNSCIMFVVTADLDGLELLKGRFGSLPTTLLLTNMLANVLFFRLAIIGMSGKVSLRNSSWSISGQCALNISLIASHSGLYFTGRTRGAVSLLFLVEDMISSRLLNGYSSSTLVSSFALYPLSISFVFNCLVMLVKVSGLVLNRKYPWISPLGIAILVHSGW